MAYLPVYCEACCRASMATEDAERVLHCTFCEGAARVIPGPIYSDDDWLAFAELDTAVFDAALDGVQAAALAEDMRTLQLSSAARDEVTSRMLQLLPSLSRVRPALVNRWPRGPRMLVTLLEARSRERTFTGPQSSQGRTSPPAG